MKLMPASEALPAGTLALDNTEDVQALAERLDPAAAVALHFPKWTDGRAYSQAVLLRQRLRHRGEIIATGAVLVDMLPLLRRCGFSAAQLRADQDLQAAQRALGFFNSPRETLHYQRAPGDVQAQGAPA